VAASSFFAGSSSAVSALACGSSGATSLLSGISSLAEATAFDSTATALA
jgi:hypothetical protein